MNSIIVILIIYSVVSFILARYPKLIVPFVIFLSPFERFNFYIGFTLSPIIIFFPFFILLIIWLILKNKITLKLLLADTKLLMIIALLLVVNIISIILSPFRGSIYKSFFYILILYFYLYFCYILIIRYRNYKQIFNSIIISIFMVATYGIYQFIAFKFNFPVTLFIENFFNSKTLSPYDFIFQVRNIVFIRPNSTFSDVNSTAGYLLLYLPFIFGYSLLNLNKKFYIILLSIIILAFISMYSRGSLISLIGVLLVGIVTFICIIYIFKNMDLSSFINTSRKIILILICLLIVLLLIAIYIIIKLRFNTIIKIQNYSNRVHLELFFTAIQMLKTNYLFGSGLSSFTKFFYNNFTNLIPDKFISVDNPNMYLKWLGEIGILGFFINIFLILYIFFISIKNYLTYNKKKKIYVVLLLLGYVSVLADNLTHAYLSLFPFILFVSIILSYIQYEKVS